MRRCPSMASNNIVSANGEKPSPHKNTPMRGSCNLASSNFSMATLVSSSLSAYSSSTQPSEEASTDGTGGEEDAKRGGAAGEKRKRDEEVGETINRAELKCQREKRRRHEMNKAFDDLTSALKKIDPTMQTDAIFQDTPGGSAVPALSSSNSSLSRVEVINRTAVILHKLHTENEDRKDQIAELTAKLEVARNARDQALASLVAPNNNANACASRGFATNQQGVVPLLQPLAVQIQQQQTAARSELPSMQLPSAHSAHASALTSALASALVSSPHMQNTNMPRNIQNASLGLSSHTLQRQVLGSPGLSIAALLALQENVRDADDSGNSLGAPHPRGGH